MLILVLKAPLPVHLPAPVSAKAAERGLSPWVPYTYEVDLEEAPGCCLQTGPVSAFVDIWKVNQRMEYSLPLSPYPSLPLSPPLLLCFFK